MKKQTPTLDREVWKMCNDVVLSLLRVPERSLHRRQMLEELMKKLITKKG